jgi:hypothetical protein
MGALLVRGVSATPAGVHPREVWCGEKGAGRRYGAVRARQRLAELRHGAERREGAARPAGIVVDRHQFRSGESGIETEPSRNFVGPAAVGLMSNSKMPVGIQSVAQAFGMSTTPEMWPWTGAVPRIE